MLNICCVFEALLRCKPLLFFAASPLEGYKPHEWVAFERALVVRDIFTGGVRTFLSTADAQAFRSLIYKQYSKMHMCVLLMFTSYLVSVTVHCMYMVQYAWIH